MGSHQPKSGAKVEYSSQMLRPRINTLQAIAAQVVIDLFTRVRIRSRRRINITSVITGSGRTKLSTTWLITNDCVVLKPSRTTRTAGIIVTNRLTQMGIVKPTKPCIITWPAIVPTVELESPEARSEMAKPKLAAPPSRGGSVGKAALLAATYRRPGAS